MTEQISIKTAEDLLDALRNDSLSVRAATLKAITAQPAKAVSVCSRDGRDLFEEMRQLCDRVENRSLRPAYIFTLLNMRDARGMALARKEFLATDDSRIVLLTAKKIAALPRPERTAFLAPVLRAGGRPTRTRAAANLLVDCCDLVPDLVLRIAMMSDHELPLPPVDSGNLDRWLAELQGPYPQAALKLLKKIHGGSPSVLLSFRQRLPEAVIIKVLRELARHPCDRQREVLWDIVRSADGDVLLWALKCLQSLPGGAADEHKLEPLYRHEDAEIRAAAIGCGTTQLDWPVILGSEPSEKVQLAVIARIESCEDSGSINFLAALMRSSGWRIRARAARALAALAPESLDVLTKMLSCPEAGVRASACKALRALGREELIKDRLDL